MERFKKFLFVTAEIFSKASVKSICIAGVTFLVALGCAGTLDIIESRQRKKR